MCTGTQRPGCTGMVVPCFCCPNSSTSLCLHRNTVYQLTYKACGKFYIGSTTRFLHNRAKEHLTNENSSVKKHLITCHHSTQNIEAKIITRENDPANLRLYEAFDIRKHKPELKSSEEMLLTQRPIILTRSQTFHHATTHSLLCVPLALLQILIYSGTYIAVAL